MIQLVFQKFRKNSENSDENRLADTENSDEFYLKVSWKIFEDYIKGTITDYKNEILRDYLERKEDHELLSDLEAPSSSQLQIIAYIC